MTSLCRFCALNVDCCYNIFTHYTTNGTSDDFPLLCLTEIFKDIPRFSPHDGLPQSICLKCKSELELSYLFVQQIKSANISLIDSKIEKKVKTEHAEVISAQVAQIDSVSSTKNEKKLRHILPKPENEKPNDNNLKSKNEHPSKGKIKNPRQYDCFECGQNLHSHRRLREHEKTHTIVNICTFCNSMFSNADAVDLHAQQKHKDKKYHCLLCEMRYASIKNFHKHIQTVHNLNSYYVCTLCIQSQQTVYSNKIDVLEHFEIVHLQQMDDELDMNEEFLDEFLLGHDAGEENSLQFSESWADLDLRLEDVLRIKTNENNGQSNGTPAYKCPICFEEFTFQKKLLIHLGHVHNRNVLICNKCEATFSRMHALTEHKMVHRLKDDCFQSSFLPLRLQCKICDKVFRTSAGLNYHIKTHSGLKPHNCPYCHKKFQANTNLKKHLHVVHSNVKHHICSLCDKKFATLDHLKKHFLSSHQTERHHFCNECGKGFSQLCHLKQHTLIHTRNSR